MRAAVLSIGDELVLGQSLDTNSQWLSEQLTRRGIMTAWHMTVPDDQAAIESALRAGCEAADLLLVTGGLGPTDDDLTRQALAMLLGVELELHQPSLDQIQAFFDRRNRPMAERNRMQAMAPAGATALDNPFGTAPGIRANHQHCTVFCMPGVPSEMRGLWQRHIAPWLDEATPNGGANRCILTAKLNTFGLGESSVADLLRDLMQRDRNPMVGTTVTDGIIAVRIRSEFPTPAQAQQALDETIAECKQRLGDLMFGRDGDTLAEAVGTLLAEAGQTIATAESCTAGLVANMLTDVPGSSSWFPGGWVTYADVLKQQELGVPESLLNEHGAVSEPVAMAMAEGARREADSDYALSLTGIAGPTGGTEEKPVGLVWFALAERGRDTVAESRIFHGSRTEVRDRAAKHALNMLRLRLLRNRNT